MDTDVNSDTVKAGGSSERNPDGTFARGHGVTNLGACHKSSWIRQQIQDCATDAAIEKLKALGVSAKSSDLDIFWKVVVKSLPQQIQAEVGALGSLGAEVEDSLKRISKRDLTYLLRLLVLPTLPFVCLLAA